VLEALQCGASRRDQCPGRTGLGKYPARDFTGLALACQLPGSARAETVVPQNPARRSPACRSCCCAIGWSRKLVGVPASTNAAGALRSFAQLLRACSLNWAGAWRLAVGRPNTFLLLEQQSMTSRPFRFRRVRCSLQGGGHSNLRRDRSRRPFRQAECRCSSRQASRGRRPGTQPPSLILGHIHLPWTAGA